MSTLKIWHHEHISDSLEHIMCDFQKAGYSVQLTLSVVIHNEEIVRVDAMSEAIALHSYTGRKRSHLFMRKFYGPDGVGKAKAWSVKSVESAMKKHPLLYDGDICMGQSGPEGGA